MTAVTVALLGPLELRVDGRLVEVTRARLRALLCALALRAGRVAPMDTLVARVWGEQVPDQPHSALHSLISQLRRLVGADVVRTGPGGYLLDVPPDAVDALRFQRLLDSVPEDDPAEARRTLVEALRLWRSDAAGAGLPVQLEADMAAHLVERYLSATERRIDIDLELGRHAELIGELRELTTGYELRGLAVIDGAHRLAVGELPVDDAITLVEGVVGAGRCAREPAALTELVDLCGRLPLALVIAAQQAARYPDAPIADLVADLRTGSDRLDLLAEPGDPAADPRTVFSWSYHALAPDAARAFRLLSLHPTAEITVPAAAVLLRASDSVTRGLLDVLASVHLLEQEQRGRYRFHDLLQAYALERARAEEPAADVRAARERILDWYLRTMAQARTAAFGALPFDVPPPADDFRPPQSFPDFSTTLAWYDHNRTTLLAAVEYAGEHGFDRHGWQLAFVLRYFHEVLRQADDAMAAAEVAVRCATRLNDDEAILYAKYTMGTAYDRAGQFTTAQRWLREAAELGERLDDEATTATTHVAFALTEYALGRTTSAVTWLERAVTVATRSGAPAALAHALLNLGAIQGMLGMAEAALDSGQLDAALVYADEALALHGAVEDQVSIPGTLIVKGRILARLGRGHAAHGRAAHETWHRALRILARTGNPRAADVEKLLADEHPELGHS
jgi:tetratricopeptide (TPR) repeat protein